MALLTISVAETKYLSLYHYQPYLRDRLEATLRDRAIYLPSPSEFNDPWDCRPWFDLAVLDDAVMRERHIKWFIDLVPSVNDANEADELRRNPQQLKNFIEKLSRELGDKINQDHRLYCLTPKNNNPLMWSHYADKHKGVCLQFDTHTESIARAFKVSYQKKLPLCIILEHADGAATRALLTKSDVWKYEKEFRLIARDARVKQLPNIPVATDGFMPIGDRALVGIIIGCQCDDADEIIGMVRRHQPTVMVRKAKRQPHRYGLDFETLYVGV